MNFLEKIVGIKKLEVQKAKQSVSLPVIYEQSVEKIIKSPLRDFTAPFRLQPFSVVAEIKLASPSEGSITNVSHLNIAREYAQSEADCISVLTESEYFKGHLSYIAEIKEVVVQPILRKDFIIDEYQIYESVAAGADAVLLIAAILSETQLKYFISLAKEFGLSTLVEVHNKSDLEKALNVGAEIIGINNRDLSTLAINLSTTQELMLEIPKNKIVISESGIKTPADVQFLKKCGVQGILVGTSIIKSNNYIEYIKQLKHA